MDKEKQIEEMARIFGSCKIFPNCITCDRHCGIRGCYNRDRAKVLYEHGYRKINENEVVISKEEKQKLLKEMYEQGKFDALADLEKDYKVVISKEQMQKIAGDYAKDCLTFYEQARKETAREIYEQLQGHGTTYVKKWIKEQYGVDLGE